MAFALAGVSFDGLLAVFCVLCIGVHGKNDSSLTIIATASTPNIHVTPTTTAMLATSSSVKPTPTTTPSSMTVTVPTTPSNRSTTPTPGNHSSTPPTKPGSHSSPLPTTKVNPSATPTPKGHGKDHGGSGSSSGKWVATGFAVLFGLTTIVMTVLYCRQRKIYRELEGDSSLSRLI